MKTNTQISEHLKANGVKPSVQRVKVYEYLINHFTHPTVDTIYKDLVSEIPTLSKTTVYNTLKLFVDSKIVALINIEDNETRYDGDTRPHGHFKCERCGEVYDFNYDDSKVKIERLEGFHIMRKDFFIKGICKICLQ